MDEYIKRKYAVDAVVDVYYDTPDINLSCEKFEAAILKIQAADVAPVRHGRWVLEREPDGKPYCFHCSVCDDEFHDIGITVAYDYCPNCGAKMYGGED